MSKGKESKINLVTILIIPIAVAINWVGGTLAGLLKLPIYLDSIGTFLVSILAGPIVGCITGILSNVVVSLTAPTALPYAIVSAIFGITTGLLAKKGMFIDVKRFIISGVLIILMGVFASIFVVVVFFGGFDGTTSSAIIGAMITAGVPFWPAQVIGNFIAAIPDKFISLLIPYMVIRNMSDRNLYKFANGPVFIEARKRAKEAKDAQKSK